MSEFCTKDLIREAKAAVADASYDPKKLALIHTGVAAAASLILALLTYFLDAGIGNTGGLSGMENRALLETVQSVLQMAVMILSPFWALGFVASALRLARRQRVDGRTLLTGLHRWGPALRLLLLQGLIYFAVAMAAVQIGSVIYSMTPASAQLESLLEQLLAGGTADADALAALMENLDSDVMMQILLGMLPFLLVPIALLLIPVAYRMRLAQYILMDEPGCGALYAIMMSFRMTKGNCLKLLKLDIRYWWYYGLEVLVSVLAFGDLLLQQMDLPLNVSESTLSVVFYVLTLGAQLALYAWKKPQLFTTYALFYDGLRPMEEPEIQM